MRQVSWRQRECESRVAQHHRRTSAAHMPTRLESPASSPHDPAEALPVSTSRHSECSDCHDSHAAQATTTLSSADVQQSLAGVSGINAAGSTVNPANYQYEICFKCHADSSNKPQSAAYGMYGRQSVRVTWSTDPYNVRLDT